MARLQGPELVRVLGPLELVADGDRVPLRPAQRRLLAILLLEPGAVIDRDTLVDRMWGEDLPATAAAALHVHLSGIRKAVPGLLVSIGGGYRIELAHHRLDRHTFEQLAARARSAAGAGDPESALRAVERARALWRGTPYAELEEDDAASAVVARLVALRDELGEIRADALLGLGRTDEAIAERRAAVRRHPLREPDWARLMRTLAGAGRQAEALRAYQAARATLGAELGVEPGDELRRLEAGIASGDVGPGEGRTGAPGATPGRADLPVAATTFVGREADVESVQGLLDTHRLVTIAGGPGLGKTRLAVEAAREAAAAYPEGTWFVGLSGARTSGDVVAAIAAATGVRSQQTTPSLLAERLAERGALLLLDNCEQVLSACGDVCSQLLERPGPLRVLVTSRRPLRHRDEAVWRLAPLPTPSDPDRADPARSLLASPAARMFLDRVRDADRTFRLTAANAGHVAALCRQADGVPLALELAAAWVPGLGLDDAALMLAGDELPPGPDAPRPARHRSLDTALAWSEALLAPQDRETLHALAVFRGPFSIEDVIGIGAPGGDRRRVAAAVRRLVDASLLVADRREDGRVAYRMLVPVRELARERLIRGRSWGGMRRRFVAHYLGKLRGPEEGGMRALVDLARVDEDLDNLREAFALGIADGRADDVARGIVALDGYFRNRFLAGEEREWLARVLPGVRDPDTRARALLAAGQAAQATNDLDAALNLLEETLASFRALRATDGIARCLLALAGLRSNRGEWEEGARAAQQGRDLAAPDDPAAQGVATFYLGTNLAYGGRVDEGIAAILDAARLFGRSREAGREAHALSTAAFLATLAADERSARRHAEQALRLARRSESPVRIVRALASVMAAEARWGDPARAAALVREIDGEMGIPQANEDVFELLFPAAFLVRRVEAWEVLLDLVDAAEARIARTGQGYPVPWRMAAAAWRDEAAAHVAASAFPRASHPVSVTASRAAVRALAGTLIEEQA